MGAEVMPSPETILEVLAYGLSLLSLFLLSTGRPIRGYLVGILDVIPWTMLALGHFDAPLMVVLEAVYLTLNVWGLLRSLKGTTIHEPC